MSSPPSPGSESPDVHDPRVVAAIRRYWRSNVRLQLGLLALWALAGLGCGVLFADLLQAWLPGRYLGFWFAQQGSILTFVLLILVYALVMDRLDARHRRELAALETGDAADEEPVS